MEDIIEKIEYKGYFINIYNDDMVESPREWEDLGIMVCFHSRYALGDKHNYSGPDDFMRSIAYDADATVDDRIEYWENGKGYSYYSNKYQNYNDIEQAIDNRIQKIIQKAVAEHYIILPLYLYDHSGITISTGRFSCPWDSGQVGYIYVAKEKIRKEWNKKLINKTFEQKIVGYLENEVKTYDDFLTGNVYGFSISDNAETDTHLDSCWGFFGTEWEGNGLFEHAKPAIDYLIEEKEKAEKAKEYKETIISSFSHV